MGGDLAKGRMDTLTQKHLGEWKNHVGWLDSLNRRYRNTLALAGIGSTSLTILGVYGLSLALPLSGFQTALVAFVGLLGSLTLARGLVARRARTLRAEIEMHCCEAELSVASCRKACQVSRERWYFACRLSEGELDKKG